MRLKDNTVKLHGIRPELLFALQVAAEVYKVYGQELVITSCNDSKHAPTSLHYAGCAVDMRTHYFTDSICRKVVSDIKERLGIDFDVVLEKDHLHIEYQPRGRN